MSVPLPSAIVAHWTVLTIMAAEYWITLSTIRGRPGIALMPACPVEMTADRTSAAVVLSANGYSSTRYVTESEMAPKCSAPAVELLSSVLE